MTEKNFLHIPLLPLRGGLIVFPSMVIHLDVGREKSIQSLEKAMMNDQKILLAAQKESAIDEPKKDDIYTIGTVAKVNQMLKLPNGTMRVLVEGLYRAKIESFIQEEKQFFVEIVKLEDVHVDPVEEDAFMRTLLEQFEHYTRISKKISKETLATVLDIEEPAQFSDMVASHITLKMSDKQLLLETVGVKRTFKKIIRYYL
ncbi:LON peptidase substrate-binding domain-containing protein [Gracilibacillus sp. JCM 18860]|uniref:LON peptidase substrate-binding domain-containing protein n=1 Tax=Gracilibacillus sp. JCM 18860 TaxID=1306159 RepID=UPI000A9E791D